MFAVPRTDQRYIALKTLFDTGTKALQSTSLLFENLRCQYQIVATTGGLDITNPYNRVSAQNDAMEWPFF